jgi:hypothetical protein
MITFWKHTSYFLECTTSKVSFFLIFSNITKVWFFILFHVALNKNNLNGDVLMWKTTYIQGVCWIWKIKFSTHTTYFLQYTTSKVSLFLIFSNYNRSLIFYLVSYWIQQRVLMVMISCENNSYGGTVLSRISVISLWTHTHIIFYNAPHQKWVCF